VGYRGTYYSKTRETETQTETVETVASNVVAGQAGGTQTVVSRTLTTNTVIRDVEAGAGFRSAFEMGLEASFKAFRVWENVRTDALDKLRHVVEPYANYTFIPEPNLTPERLFQFDDADRLKRAHTVRLGARNQLQTRRRGRSFNLVDLDTYTTWNLEPEEGEDAFSDLTANGELRLWRSLEVDFDGVYGLPEGELTRFNTQMWLRDAGPWQASLEYRYRNGESSLIGADVTFSPIPGWALSSYTRYEMEESRLEEQGAYVQRTFDCLVFRFGGEYAPGYTRSDGSEQKEDYRVLAQVWLTAFPNLRMGYWDRD